MRIGEPFTNRLFLTVVVVCSAAPYLTSLGFYSDDWGNLEIFKFCQGRGLAELFSCIDEPYRPLQFLQLAILYRSFGTSPLGYHVFNFSLFAGLIWLLHLTLDELQFSSIVALTVPLMYSLLPHFSTDRFWIAASQANLCIFLYLAGFYSAVRATSVDESRRLSWGLASILGLVLSALSYEVAIPLFVLIPIALWPRLKRYRALLPSVLFSIAFVALGAMGYKIVLQTRHEFEGRFLKHPLAVVSHFTRQLLDFNFGYYGLGLPHPAWRAFMHQPDRRILILGLGLGVLTFWYVFRAVDLNSTNWPFRKFWAGLFFAGQLAFVLGYSPFVADVTSDITTPGVANRITIAAALGTAVSLVALVGWTSGVVLLPKVRSGLFSGVISILCVSGFFIINTLGLYWKEAYREQRRIITAVTAAFPALTPQKTLIIDGVCAYLGPGIVFEGADDTSAMLRVTYGDRTIRGNILTPSMDIRPEGLHASLYTEESLYPYGPGLVVYDIETNVRTRLVDIQTARDYFEARQGQGQSVCPLGREGYGSPIF
jgi:hypothetical protein